MEMMEESGAGESTTVFEVTNPDLPQEHVTTKGGEDIEEASSESKPQEVSQSKAKAEPKEVVTESYTPDFSYSVLDQKKEFPEWVRQAIKDKKAEDELRDLYTRAEGLAPVKEKFEGLNQRYAELEGKHNQVTEKLGELQYYIDKGHYDHFFKEIGLPQQKIVEYVASILKEQDMDPQQRAQLQAFREQDIASFHQVKNTQLLQQQNRQLMMNQHQIQMDQAMMMPEVKRVAEYVDSVQGPGSFKNSVNQFGLTHYHQNGFDLPAAEAVARVMQQYKAFLPKEDVAQDNDLISAKSELKSGRPTGHIPNVGKKTGASPVKKAIRSLDDLKKLAQQA